MNRSSRVAVAGAAMAVAGFGMAGIAQAAGAGLMLSSSTVMQGSTIWVTATCPGANSIAVLGSAALPGRLISLPMRSNSMWKISWRIGHVMPGTYAVGLACGTKAGKLTGFTKTWVRVVKSSKPVPPTPPGPRVVFGPTIMIHSGFGGLAGQVASHHPAG